MKCSADELCRFIDGSRRLADGWISFYWGTTIEEYKAKKKPSIADGMAREWIERFRKRSPTMTTRSF